MTLLSHLKVSNLAIKSKTAFSEECLYSLNEQHLHTHQILGDIQDTSVQV